MSFTHDRVYVRKYGTNTPLLYISHHHPCIQALHPSKPLSQVTAISCHSSLFSYQTNTHFFQFTNTIHSIKTIVKEKTFKKHVLYFLYNFASSHTYHLSTHNYIVLSQILKSILSPVLSFIKKNCTNKIAHLGVTFMQT